MNMFLSAADPCFLLFIAASSWSSDQNVGRTKQLIVRSQCVWSRPLSPPTASRAANQNITQGHEQGRYVTGGWLELSTRSPDGNRCHFRVQLSCCSRSRWGGLTLGGWPWGGLLAMHRGERMTCFKWSQFKLNVRVGQEIKLVASNVL